MYRPNSCEHNNVNLLYYVNSLHTETHTLTNIIVHVVIQCACTYNSEKNKH